MLYMAYGGRNKDIFIDVGAYGSSDHRSELEGAQEWQLLPQMFVGRFQRLVDWIFRKTVFRPVGNDISQLHHKSIVL